MQIVSSVQSDANNNRICNFPVYVQQYVWFRFATNYTDILFSILIHVILIYEDSCLYHVCWREKSYIKAGE